MRNCAGASITRSSALVRELNAAGLERRVAQAFAVLLPVQAVGVMGDARTYESVVALRAVETDDFMTADWSRLSHDLLIKPPRISDRRGQMGEMKRAIAREQRERAKAMEEQKRMTDRFVSTLVIAASIIAAVRLAREQDI